MPVSQGSQSQDEIEAHNHVTDMIRPRWLAVLLVFFRPFGAVTWWLRTALVSLLRVSLFKVLRVLWGPREQRQESSLSPKHPHESSRQVGSSANASHTPGKASMDEAASVRNEQPSVEVPLDVGTIKGLPTLVSKLAKGPVMHTSSGGSSPSAQQLPSSVSSGVLSPSETSSAHGMAITTPLLPNGRPHPGDFFDDYEPARLEFTKNGYLITGSQEKQGVRISIDTQGEVSIMRSGVFNKLGLPLEPCTESLVPFRQAADTASIPTVGKVRVDWSFAQDFLTYQTDFYVVENNQFDVLIGVPTISQYKLLQTKMTPLAGKVLKRALPPQGLQALYLI